MSENFEYPLMPDWSKEEIIKMIEFYAEVEKAYTTGVSKTEFLAKVADFKQIEPAIADQKRIDRQYQKVSGFSIYRAIKAVQNTSKKFIKVEE